MFPYQRLAGWVAWLALPGLLTVACARKSTNPDPRDAYVGTWIEQSSNGVPTAPGSVRDTLVISKADADKLRIDKLIAAGSLSASRAAAGPGYQADNVPINTGTVINFQNGTRAAVMLTSMTLVLSGGPLSMSVAYGAQSGTQSVRQTYAETLTRQ